MYSSRVVEQVVREIVRGEASAVLGVVVRAKDAREDDRSIPVVVATEKALPGYDSGFNRVDQMLLLSDGNLPAASVSLVDSHDSGSVAHVLGSVRDWAYEDAPGGKALVGRMYFAQSQQAFDAYRNYRDGHLQDVSIRAYATRKPTRVEPGETAEIEGRALSAAYVPLDVFERWAVYEVSAVVRGADVDARVKRALKGDADMDFEKWLTKRGVALEGLDEVRRAALKAEFEAERKASETPAPPPALTPAPEVARQAAQVDVAGVARQAVADALAQARKDEVARVARIREVCGSELPDLERQALGEGWDVERTQSEALKAVRARLDSGVGSPAIHVGGGAMTRDLLVDGLCLRSGLESVLVAEQDGANRAQRAHALRDTSLVDVCREVLRIDGQSIPRGRSEMLRAAASTMTLPYVLGNVANKSALRGYALAAATWRNWCTTGSVSDFKTNTGVRLTDVGDLKEVSVPNGEVQSGSAVEEYEQYAVARYSKKAVIGETQLINDDLGMLSRIPQAMGDRAAALISKLVYEHLLANGNMTDGNALFSSAHSNYVTGSGYKLSTGAAALRKALETFRKQTNADSQPIDVSPAFVLCAPEDEEYARALLRSITLAEGTTAGLATANIWGSMGMAPVVESRLSNSGYSGYSTTAWYLIGNPAQVDTVLVAFLNGQEAPRMEYFSQAQMGIDTIGVGYRVTLDCGVKALDWRGMVKMTGA